MSAHRHDPSLAAAAALGDLSPGERARWVRLRRACADCRRLEHEMDATLAELAFAAPRHEPPPGLLDGIRAAIRVASDRA